MDDLRKSIHSYRKEVIELAEQQLEETQAAHQKGQVSFVTLMDVQPTSRNRAQPFGYIGVLCPSKTKTGDHPTRIAGALSINLAYHEIF